MPPPQAPRQVIRRRRASVPIVAALLALALGGCASTTTVGPPQPTPEDITGIAADLRAEGVTISHLVSGDAGCDDPDMIASAIWFEASGLDQRDAVPVRIYIFRNADSYQEQRPAVDACAAAWITDPAGLEVFDASPFVVVGQGPWPAEFKAALRAGLDVAAGDGG